MKPGLYPDLPAADYHAVQAMSAGGLKRMRRSPAHFYGAQLDPLRPQARLIGSGGVARALPAVGRIGERLAPGEHLAGQNGGFARHDPVDRLLPGREGARLPNAGARDLRPPDLPSPCDRTHACSIAGGVISGVMLPAAAVISEGKVLAIVGPTGQLESAGKPVLARVSVFSCWCRRRES